MKTAYSYIRFSTPDQIKGDSLRRQTESTERFCARHKLQLDSSLNITDLGVSAFKGGNTSTGNLGKFLELVHAKQVKKGSVLVVEKLDRLSRQEVLPALNLIQKIIEAGVEVGVVDNDKIYGVKDLADTMTIMFMVMQFATANEESRKKSERIGAAWTGKRKNAENKKITGRCPAWLKLSSCGTKFEEIPERVKVIKDIFAWTIEGHGATAIVKRLTNEGIQPFESVIWHRSYIMKILTGKAVVGEFQPRSINPEWKPGSGAKQHVPIGEPIKGYFPSIISDSDYYRSRKAMGERKLNVGKAGKGVPNLFTGVLFNMPDKSTMTIVNKGNKSVGKVLVPSHAKAGVGVYVSFPYAAFESAFLRSLKELTPNDVRPITLGKQEDETEKLATHLIKIEGQIAKLKKKLLDEDDFESGWDMLKSLEAKKKHTFTQLEEQKAKGTTSDVANLQEVKAIIDLDLNDLDVRTRIKGKIRGLVEAIYMKISGSKSKSVDRLAVCQMKLRNGKIKALHVKGDGSYLLFDFGTNLKAGDLVWEEFKR